MSNNPEETGSTEQPLLPPPPSLFEPRVGDAVMCLFGRNNLHYAATVTARNADGTFLVTWKQGGSTQDACTADMMESPETFFASASPSKIMAVMSSADGVGQAIAVLNHIAEVCNDTSCAEPKAAEFGNTEGFVESLVKLETTYKGKSSLFDERIAMVVSSLTSRCPENTAKIQAVRQQVATEEGAAAAAAAAVSQTTSSSSTTASPPPSTPPRATYHDFKGKFEIGQDVDVRWPSVDSSRTWPAKIIAHNTDFNTYTVKWNSYNYDEADVDPHRITASCTVYVCFNACCSCCTNFYMFCTAGGSGCSCDQYAGICGCCYEQVCMEYLFYYTCGSARTYRSAKPIYCPCELIACPVKTLLLLWIVVVKLAITIAGAPMACMCIPVCGPSCWTSYTQCICNFWAQWPSGECKEPSGDD